MRFAAPDDFHFASALSANFTGRNLLQVERERISLRDVQGRRRVSVVLRNFYDAEIDMGSLHRTDPEILDYVFRAAELSRARDFLGSVYRRVEASGQPVESAGLTEFEALVSYQSALLSLEDYRADNSREQVFVNSLRRSLRSRVGSINSAALVRFDDPSAMDSGVATARTQRAGIGEALVMYHVTDSGVYAFVITHRSAPRLVVLPISPAKLRNRARSFYRQLATGPRNRDVMFETLPAVNTEAWRVTGRELYTWLIQPIEQYLDRVDRLLIVPHDLLHLVPFAALPLNEGVDKFLIDRYSLVSLPTPMFRGWSSMRRREIEKSALVVGINKFALANKLTYAEQEARVIAGLFKDADLMLGSRQQAKYWNIARRMPVYALIHIASHGLYIPSAPNASNVILQGSDRQTDEPLTSADVIGMRISASLVVLSACQTATPSERGLPADGDILGLPRSFLIAGAERVIASLWSVNDRSTQEFFEHLYGILYGGLETSAPGLPRQEFDAALASAQRRLRRDYPHPFFWAPFVLIGAP